MTTEGFRSAGPLERAFEVRGSQFWDGLPHRRRRERPLKQWEKHILSITPQCQAFSYSASKSLFSGLREGKIVGDKRAIACVNVYYIFWPQCVCYMSEDDDVVVWRSKAAQPFTVLTNSQSQSIKSQPVGVLMSFEVVICRRRRWNSLVVDLKREGKRENFHL